jgi:hypothetical protein
MAVHHFPPPSDLRNLVSNQPSYAVHSPKLGIPVHNVAKPAITKPVPSGPRYVPPVPPVPLPLLNDTLSEASMPNPTFVRPPALLKPSAPKPIVKPVDAALIESRIRAAQRIRAYEESMQAKIVKKPAPYRGPAFQFAAAKQGGYQKPRDDLSEQKLPKLFS